MEGKLRAWADEADEGGNLKVKRFIEEKLRCQREQRWKLQSFMQIYAVCKANATWHPWDIHMGLSYNTVIGNPCSSGEVYGDAVAQVK